jgi:hypothetical protein
MRDVRHRSQNWTALAAVSPLLSQLRVRVNARFGPYNDGLCVGDAYMSQYLVGSDTCQRSAFSGAWYSLPPHAACGDDALGTRNCSYQTPVLVKTIDLSCLFGVSFACICGGE